MSPPRKARRTRFGVLAPCCALLIASCWATSGTAVTTALPDASPGATNATGSASRRPALKPIDPAAFQSAVAGAARKLFVAGAVVLLRTPQGTFEAKVGATDLSGHAPPDAGTHFRIASNTKTMTSALIMLLAQDGGLHLGDPVSAYVPDVPGGKHRCRPPRPRPRRLPARPAGGGLGDAGGRWAGRAARGVLPGEVVAVTEAGY
ncbi:serine hydrolase, partial [Streptomyces mirabilis]|uniref:serine hydrolase n=1 Tax=Streptomyces mirabilis TaxID=68239 RepID=UPI0036B67255